MVSEMIIGGSWDDMCVDVGGVDCWVWQWYGSKVGIEYATFGVEEADELFQLAVVKGNGGVGEDWRGKAVKMVLA